MIQKYYEGTPRIINLAAAIGKLLGVVDATYLRKPKTRLRKDSQIKTIQSSLAIEGNTLSLDQVSALFDNKRVIGPSQDILEVQNAIAVYRDLSRFDPFSEKAYLEAHRLLMKGLVDYPGRYRTGHVGIFKGDQVAHLAPPAWNVPHLMSNLFRYLVEHEDHLVIKSCVFHYEMEFIHPFMDGNGRMGRLWQTLILMQENPTFEFLPIEAAIKDSQQEYYAVLAAADKAGIATLFVEYMLEIIRKSLDDQVGAQRVHLSAEERVAYFQAYAQRTTFTRKDYLQVFKDISPATATRDLRIGVEKGILIRRGENRNTTYAFSSSQTT